MRILPEGVSILVDDSGGFDDVRRLEMPGLLLTRFPGGGAGRLTRALFYRLPAGVSVLAV